MTSIMDYMENVLLRQFSEEDQEALYELHIAGLEQTNSLISGEAREVLDQDLKNICNTYIHNNGEFLVAKTDNKIVGIGGLKKVDKETAEIKRMRVEEISQGKGIGSLILDKLIERAHELGYKKLILDTSTTQIPAHRLYESRGFREYKREPVYGQETIFYKRDI